MPEEDRQALRSRIRMLRRAVPAETNRESSEIVCASIAASRVYRDSQHIAFFIAADGELDLSPLLRQAQKDGKQCYLPVSLTDGSWMLQFLPYTLGDQLNRTKLGVLEPADTAKPHAPEALDLVLTPLVAFDSNCYRMGMGKGYYDRTFAFKNPQNSKNDRETPPKSPKLLGIAHTCQHLERLTCAWWDVPLDAVITPEQVYGDALLLQPA